MQVIGINSTAYSNYIPAQTKAGIVSYYVAALNSKGMWNKTQEQLVEILEPTKDVTLPFVVSSIPDPDSKGVKIKVLIKIIFSESMNSSRVRSALTIEPDANYNLIWLDNNILLKL